MKKLFLLGACLLAASSLFAGGGSQKSDASSGGVTTIEFFQQKMEEGPQRGYQAVVDRFNAEYAGKYKVEMNTVPDAGRVLTSRVVAGDIPPLFSDYPTQLQFKEKVANGYIMDLTGQSFMSRVNPPALDMSKAPDGRDYAMPLSHNFMGVYYNIDIFNKYGLTVPNTYAEFIAACKKLKDNGVLPIVFSYQNVGRVGHMFQAMNVAWTVNGVEKFVNVMNKKGQVVGDPVFQRLAEKMTEVTSFGNADAFSVPDTAMWETFANGGAAMCITGSYARGTILLANPNLKMGVFPIPNDTVPTTTLLTGIDAALCVSARATPAQKEAALAFLEFLSRTPNGQTFCDADGAPSCLTAVVYKDDGLGPITAKMQAGPLWDWMGSFIPTTIVNEMYSVTQQFLLDKNAGNYLSDLQNVIVTGAEQAGL
ncbi:sugar ABC transporter substrate-binding protein [Spirochaetia bacterium]|nr:sugar ABC transporter substrate-binding protein [Spirochaetia bacterium]